MPNTGRDDYDQLLHVRAVGDGEPYFLIRGQDAVSADAVRAWAALAFQAGSPIPIVEQALQQADALEAWTPKKVPDAGHLDEEERKQLTYQFGRRAWGSREDCADLRIMMAEERALQAALAQLRPVLTAFFARLQQLPNGAFLYNPKAVDADGEPVPGCDAIAALGNLRATLDAKHKENDHGRGG